MSSIVKYLELKKIELNLCMKSDYVNGQLDLVNELLDEYNLEE